MLSPAHPSYLQYGPLSVIFAIPSTYFAQRFCVVRRRCRWLGTLSRLLTLLVAHTETGRRPASSTSLVFSLMSYSKLRVKRCPCAARSIGIVANYCSFRPTAYYCLFDVEHRTNRMCENRLAYAHRFRRPLCLVVSLCLFLVVHFFQSKIDESITGGPRKASTRRRAIP